MFSGNIELELYPLDQLNQKAGPDLFSQGEREVCTGLKTAKRRRDWIAGRVAVKRLVRRKLAAAGVRVPLHQIEVYNRPSGEPYVQLPPNVLKGLDVRISISHSSQYALAALANGVRLGADVETIERRDKSWLELMAHESEAFEALQENPTAQTVLWTMKESILKVLGVGLSVSLQDVRFVPDASGTPVISLGTARLELHGKAKRVWEELRRPAITIESSLMGDDSTVSVAYTPHAARSSFHA
ncbi:MAG: 4'-phosphopantetheinyl transferase superfamily protein [Elusimicrobia bacterium]|nr:4'-phosphopantetheinyl transferase superfamily protein [Elusimicrobiota bacterium]